MKIEYIDPYHLTPYQRNNKIHDKQQIERIASSIDQFGFLQPVVIDKENVIIVGHARVEAQKLRGNEPVPVVRVEGLSEEEIRAYRIVDNKLNSDAGYNWQAVVDEIQEITDSDLLTSFGLSEWAERANEIVGDAVKEIDVDEPTEKGRLLKIEVIEGSSEELKGLITKAANKAEIKIRWV